MIEILGVLRIQVISSCFDWKGMMYFEHTFWRPDEILKGYCQLFLWKIFSNYNKEVMGPENVQILIGSSAKTLKDQGWPEPLGLFEHELLSSQGVVTDDSTESHICLNPSTTGKCLRSS